MSSGSTTRRSALEWCRAQKRGLRLTAPSSRLAAVFLGKAQSALNMLDSALGKGEMEWVAATAYYAKYFALYAILTKCGISCEIHDCTLLAMRTLFVERGKLDASLYEDILDSKDLRIDLQYYAHKGLDRGRVMRRARSAPRVVLALRAFSERLTAAEIRDVRAALA